MPISPNEPILRIHFLALSKGDFVPNRGCLESTLKEFEGEDSLLVSDIADVLEKEIQYFHFGIPKVENSTLCYGDSGGPTYVERGGQVLCGSPSTPNKEARLMLDMKMNRR